MGGQSVCLWCVGLDWQGIRPPTKRRRQHPMRRHNTASRHHAPGRRRSRRCWERARGGRIPVGPPLGLRVAQLQEQREESAIVMAGSSALVGGGGGWWLADSSVRHVTPGKTRGQLDQSIEQGIQGTTPHTTHPKRQYSLRPAEEALDRVRVPADLGLDLVQDGAPLALQVARAEDDSGATRTSAVSAGISLRATAVTFPSALVLNPTRDSLMKKSGAVALHHLSSARTASSRVALLGEGEAMVCCGTGARKHAEAWSPVCVWWFGCVCVFGHVRNRVWFSGVGGWAPSLRMIHQSL